MFCTWCGGVLEFDTTRPVCARCDVCSRCDARGLLQLRYRLCAQCFAAPDPRIMRDTPVEVLQTVCTFLTPRDLAVSLLPAAKMFGDEIVYGHDPKRAAAHLWRPMLMSRRHFKCQQPIFSATRSTTTRPIRALLAASSSVVALRTSIAVADSLERYVCRVNTRTKAIRLECEKLALVLDGRHTVDLARIFGHDGDDWYCEHLLSRYMLHPDIMAVLIAYRGGEWLRSVRMSRLTPHRPECWWRSFEAMVRAGAVVDPGAMATRLKPSPP